MRKDSGFREEDFGLSCDGIRAFVQRDWLSWGGFRAVVGRDYGFRGEDFWLS